eukprot:2435660-Rhodomonas_salina.1
MALPDASVLSLNLDAAHVPSVWWYRMRCTDEWKCRTAMGYGGTVRGEVDSHGLRYAATLRAVLTHAMLALSCASDAYAILLPGRCLGYSGTDVGYGSMVVTGLSGWRASYSKCHAREFRMSGGRCLWQPRKIMMTQRSWGPWCSISLRM